jgi:hypothetical protein
MARHYVLADFAPAVAANRWAKLRDGPAPKRNAQIPYEWFKTASFLDLIFRTTYQQLPFRMMTKITIGSGNQFLVYNITISHLTAKAIALEV